MSRLASTLASMFSMEKKDSARVLFLGPSASGRTTALYQMKLGEIVTTIPTIGFNVEDVVIKDSRLGQLTMTVWDVGGCDKIRPLWRHYFCNTDAIVFFVDSSDPPSFPEAKDDLNRMLNEEVLSGCPVLVLANKQDLPGAVPPSQVAKQLDLYKISSEHQWVCMPTATTRQGEGLPEAFAWLQHVLHIARACKANAPTQKTTVKSKTDNNEEEPTLLEQWLAVEDEPDDVFLKALEDYTLDTWDHRTHLRLAWLYLTRHGRREGMDHIFKSIKAFIENSPRTKRSSGNGTTFHITLTYAWAHLVHYAIASGKNPDGQFKTFLIMNPQLSNGGLLLHYYTKQLLFNSPQARTEVVLPDKRPLPSLLSEVGKPINRKAQSHPPSSLKPSPVTDTEFLRMVRAKSLNFWSHTQFLRVIWACMRLRGGRRGADLAMQLLRDFQGQDAFHYTITYFWCQAIRQLMVHDWAAAMQQLDNAAIHGVTGKIDECMHVYSDKDSVGVKVLHGSTVTKSESDQKTKNSSEGTVEGMEAEHDLFVSIFPIASASIPEFEVVLHGHGYTSQRVQKMSMDSAMYLSNYSKTCINSYTAQNGFVLPDRRPFASVV